MKKVFHNNKKFFTLTILFVIIASLTKVVTPPKTLLFQNENEVIFSYILLLLSFLIQLFLLIYRENMQNKLIVDLIVCKRIKQYMSPEEYTLWNEKIDILREWGSFCAAQKQKKRAITRANENKRKIMNDQNIKII